MHLTALTDLLRTSAVQHQLLAQLQDTGTSDLRLIRAARSALLASIAQQWHGAVVYLTARGKRAYNVAEQLPVWLGETQRIYRYAEPTPMFYDRLPWDRAVVRERLEALGALYFADDAAEKPIIIASARALMQRTLPVNTFRQRVQDLAVGQRVVLDTLIREWVGLGYEPVTMVAEPGCFSRRGGIVDIYPLAAPLPVRIELFGDEIDTLRTFNPSTQRTVETVQSVRILPARESLPDLMPPVARHLQGWFASLADYDDDLTSSTQDADSLEAGQSFAHLEHYMPYIYDNPVSLLDFADPDTLIVIDDVDELRDVVTEIIDEAEGNRETNRTTHQLPDDYPQPYITWETIAADFGTATTLFLSNAGASADIGLRFEPGQRFAGQVRPTLQYIRERRADGQRVIVVSQQTERLENLWYEQDTTAVVPKTQHLSELPAKGRMVFLQGELSEGWTLQSEDGIVHLITDAEIFGWSRPEPRRRKATQRTATKLPEADYGDWNEGDFVVHVDYGIGRFKGMMTRTIEGNDREYLIIAYSENGQLFVPIDQSDRLTRYVGPDEAPPKMSALGKQDIWTRTKEKARKNAQEEARELLQIYAARAATAGHRYDRDNAWQRELEASFPYVETDDQLRVIKEIKHDMETSMPMDRLVCGDVGYGKTEVALRAAFKAVMDGKQVAVLVPTTVLADQHYHTFSRRMEQFPVKVEVLSRFRTKAEQSDAVAELAKGNVDVVIGTHRLLSKDVKFNDLGLIIIDEEQRFGVKHKEHFKKLRAQVDVLTLTATPIPRTLYMSMSGVRDISMLQTPPEERLPVITHVGPFDPKLTRQAILRELDRGGQVFVIHNRVKTLDAIREKLEEIVPEASIVSAHGKMTGRQLETVISDFSKGSYDILLATSIIENGIDMPNVNTLIVDRADWFGMSQLYQIRGRVGRGATQAYAYFFHAGSKKLTDDARARLETLAENTSLGSGMQISLRDLELRGAGDILSTKQTGHVATVGLQLYTQLLQQAVADLKGEMDGEPVVERSDGERIVIDLPIPAYIPSDWIPEMALRLQLYRRIASIQTMEDIDAMERELRDRFGILPNAVEGLLYQIQVKLLGAQIRATGIIKPRKHFLIKLPWLMAVDRDALAHHLGDDIEVSRTAVELSFDEDIWQLRLLDVLTALKAGLPQQVEEGAGI